MKKYFKRFINSIDDWAKKTIEESEKEERQMAHMFDRLWESKKRETDEWLNR